MIFFFLSAALPEVFSETQAAFFNTFIPELAKRLETRGVSLVYGSHPSVTPLLAQVSCPSEAHALARFKAQSPNPDAIQWHGDPTGASPIADDLGTMRDAMSAKADVAVFIGGKRQGLGGRPGILDEMDRFLRAKPRGRVHLVTAVGGAAEDLATTPQSLQVRIQKGTDPLEVAEAVFKDLELSKAELYDLAHG